MDRSTIIRGKIIEKLSGYEHDGIAIPVFDEFVNPNVTIPVVGGAETYIVLQDQEQNYDAVQTLCYPRFDLNVTLRVVTKWGTVGSKKLCEDICDEIVSLIRDDRGNSLISGVQRIDMPISRTIAEQTEYNTAFSKVVTLTAVYNG